MTLTDPATGVQREFLLVEDEVAGALPTGQCPSGGVHVYEITGTMEANPVKVGFWNIDEVRPTDGLDSCTAHVFDLHEDAGIMTIAYYNGGVRVVDLNGLAGIGLGETAVVGDPMTQIGHYRIEGANTWSAKTPEIDPATGDFVLYGNDINRGLDVFRFDGEREDPLPTGRSASVGRWMTPGEATADFALRSPIDLTAYRPFCLLGDSATPVEPLA